MPLLLFILFFLFASTEVNSQSTAVPHSMSLPVISRSTVPEMLPPLHLVATPDYPVAAGQKVNLHCRADTVQPLSWFWQRLENQTWKVVSNGSDLTLTEPNESGLYSCSAESQLSLSTVSQNHTVFIVAMLPTVGENLGIAAFVFSLLNLIISVAILLWLAWQRFAVTLTISNTADKGFSGHDKAPKESSPQTEDEGDVYINYRNSNQDYTDLDPTNMAADGIYSSLS